MPWCLFSDRLTRITSHAGSVKHVYSGELIVYSCVAVNDKGVAYVINDKCVCGA